MSELFDRKQALAQGGDEARRDAQRKAGKQLARERIAKLLDEESFVEVGMFVSGRDGNAAGVVTGFGTVEDRPVYVYAQDYTLKGAGMDDAQADKIIRLLELAEKTGAPVVALLDSAGAKLDEGVKALNAYARIMAKTAQLSGVVPQIACVLGTCAGGAAYIPAMGDLIIACEKCTQMFVTGPQVVSARTGKTVSATELGGAKTLDENGLAHIAVETEDEALACARKLIGLLPANNEEDAPLLMQDDLNRMLDINTYFDVHDALVRIADFNDFTELQKGWATSMVTGFARIGGRAVGIVANNPAANDGALCACASRKAARFVRLCDSFNLPVVSLVNTKGNGTVTKEKNADAIKAGAQLIGAYAEAGVPMVSVLCGDALGTAYAAMGSRSVGADVVYAWPTAFVAPMDADAAVRVLFKDRIAAGEDIAALEAEYKAANDGFAAAKAGVVDDVIEPAATRQMIAAALEMLMGKRGSVMLKKHGNLPL